MPANKRDCEAALLSAPGIGASSPVRRDCDCRTALATDLNPETFPVGLFRLNEEEGVPAHNTHRDTLLLLFAQERIR